MGLLMRDKILKLVKVLSNIQSYFIFCFFYFLVLELRDVNLNPLGENVYYVMFNMLMPFFIVVPLLFYAILGKTNFKRRYSYILIALGITILIFELVLS